MAETMSAAETARALMMVETVREAAEGWTPDHRGDHGWTLRELLRIGGLRRLDKTELDVVTEYGRFMMGESEEDGGCYGT